MFNSFAGLEMSKRALNAFRLGIQTAGHNAANVKTEGYSRQRVELSTTTPYTSPGLSSPAIPGQIGTGVKVDEIVRIRDEFLDLQYRSEMTDLGYWEKINKMYDTVQLYLSEPAGDGVRAALDDFWTSVGELQKNPETASIRRSMVEASKTVAQELSKIVKGYDQYASMVNDEIYSAVDQINGMLHDIAALNKEIYAVEAMDQNPNDLLDKRDLLLDKLSQMIDIETQEPYQGGDVNGEFFLTLNGLTLIQGDHVRELVAHAFNWNDQVYYDVQVEDNEFDIVKDPDIAYALATGPAGVHQLNVLRKANGEAWGVGNANPYCLDENGNIQKNSNGEDIRMRDPRPTTTTQELGLESDFRIQVGTMGTQVWSKLFSNSSNPDLGEGNILGAWKDGDPKSYTFRVGANDSQVDITVEWNGTEWAMSSDTKAASSTGSGGKLSVADLSGFLQTALSPEGFTVTSLPESGTKTQFSIASDDKYLISISDVVGDLGSRIMNDPLPTAITIDVTTTDSLETIRNKINEKYQAENGLTGPEQWVHASLHQAEDQSWYISIASNVPGEAGRITLMGDESGSNQTLLRLGLMDTVLIDPGDPNLGYREVTAYSTVAEDAYFQFAENGKAAADYLSSDNTFDKARRVPAKNNVNDFSASALETVSEGMFLELRGIGSTTITVRHPVKGGSVKALEEIRDGLMPQIQAQLDELTWSLVNNFNAYQYSGYGIGEELNTTGAAFFETLRFKSGSAALLDVTDEVDGNISLIGASMGKKDENKKAVYGVSSGSGGNDNAARMAGLQSGKLLENGTASLGEYYETFLADIGSEAGRASLMYKAQQGLVDSIDEQRQSVMGVNIDEEMLDILMFNHAFNAMSRYATTIDEMLNTIINSFGVVGR